MAETQNHAGEAPPQHADDNAAVPPPPPDQPMGSEHRLALMVGTLGLGGLVCKLRKPVDHTDAKPDQSRLQLTYALARDLLESDDLTDGEKESIHGDKNNDGQKNPGLKVVGYDRDGTGYDAMRFKRMGSMNGMNGNGVYRLKGFGRFATANGLEAGHTVVAWVFRLPLPAQYEEAASAPAPAPALDEASAPPPAAKEEEEEEAAPAPAPAGAAAQQEEEKDPARLAVVLLNYPSTDPAVVEEMVEREEHELDVFLAARGILKLSNGHK